MLLAIAGTSPAPAEPVVLRLPPMGARASPVVRVPPHRGLRLRPSVGGRRFPGAVPPLSLPSPPPDAFIQRPHERLSPLIEDQPSAEPPLPGGFVLTVKVGRGRIFAVPPVLERYVDVGQALGACFAPRAGLGWSAVTLRVSFRRDGSVFGLPRIPYGDAATAPEKSELARSLLAGLKRCTPLPLSPSLGAAIAGEIFAVRFIHEDRP